METAGYRALGEFGSCKQISNVLGGYNELLLEPKSCRFAIFVRYRESSIHYKTEKIYKNFTVSF